MRSLLIRVVFLCALLLPSPLWATDMIRMPSANVIEVYDGDTFKVQLPGMLDVFGHDLPVRINGIDTPEIRSSCSNDVLRAAERQKAVLAKDFLLGALRGGQKIELHNLVRDKYFRLLADVYIDDINVGTAMIERGHAVAYDGGTKYDWCGK